MEEEEQDEEATGNPAPLGGPSEHGFPTGDFSASSAQATFFEELVKKHAKRQVQTRRERLRPIQKTAPAGKKPRRSMYLPGPRWLNGLFGSRS